MLTYTYMSKGNFDLVEKPKPTIQNERAAITAVRMWCLRWQGQKIPSSLRGSALVRMRSSLWWRFMTRRKLCLCPICTARI